MKESQMQPKNEQKVTKTDSSTKILDLTNLKLTNKIKVLKCNNQIKELHTVLRDW